MKNPGTRQVIKICGPRKLRKRQMSTALPHLTLHFVNFWICLWLVMTACHRLTYLTCNCFWLSSVFSCKPSKVLISHSYVDRYSYFRIKLGAYFVSVFSSAVEFWIHSHCRIVDIHLTALWMFIHIVELWKFTSQNLENSYCGFMNIHVAELSMFVFKICRFHIFRLCFQFTFPYLGSLNIRNLDQEYSCC